MDLKYMSKNKLFFCQFIRRIPADIYLRVPYTQDISYRLLVVHMFRRMRYDHMGYLQS
jgi:hypothetical protein